MIHDFNRRRQLRSIAQSGCFTDLELAWLAIESESEVRGVEIDPAVREAYDVQKEMLTDVECIALAD